MSDTETGGVGEGLFGALGSLLSDATEDPATLLEGMLAGLTEAFDADRGLVYMPAGEDGFRLACQHARSEEPAGEEQVSRSLVRLVADEGRPMLVTSAQTAELQQQFQSMGAELRSIMAAPLPGSTRPGVVYLDSVKARRSFSDDDRNLLLGFAEVAGGLLARRESTRRKLRRAGKLAELQRRELAGREIVGESMVMKELRAEIARAAPADVSVLVTGESGTGKELVARALHQASERADGPFVAVSCAALPAELVESELFGHEKGAFSGAAERREGRFELADGGTLFLDEVGELPLPAQAKLLRALQERVIQRVGGGQDIPVDFRLVCATNVELEEAVKAGGFREDLFYRIAVFRIRTPALRERGEDVLTLAEHFLEEFARRFRRELAGMDEDVRAALKVHEWPGNIRELRNVVEQAVIRESGKELRKHSVLPALGIAPAESPASTAGGEDWIEDFPEDLAEARKDFEARMIVRALKRAGGNMKRTAESLGLGRNSLYAKCEELGIDYSLFRD